MWCQQKSRLRNSRLSFPYRHQVNNNIQSRILCKNSNDQLRSYSSQANIKPRKTMWLPLLGTEQRNREEPSHTEAASAGGKHKSGLWVQRSGSSGLPKSLVSVSPDSEHWDDGQQSLKATKHRDEHQSTLEKQFCSQMPGSKEDHKNVERS